MDLNQKKIHSNFFTYINIFFGSDFITFNFSNLQLLLILHIKIFLNFYLIAVFSYFVLCKLIFC